ncbi:hypothetical protein ACA910_012806 [Epithemia clementina (nom. ined.)]
MNSLIASRSITLLRRSAFRAAASSSSQRTMATTPKTFQTPRAGLVPNNVLRGWYNMFGKSTAKYATWVVILVIAGELALGKVRDALWEMNNYGRTFRSTDWSKFDQFDEEEDEEGGDDEDADEEDDE